MSKQDDSNNYYYWTKGSDLQLSPHFHSKEFTCHCANKECVQQKVSKKLVEKLEAVRVSSGLSITVTSGYRCRAHQQSLKESGLQTAAGISTHELGHAADIRAINLKVLQYEVSKQFLAIGVASTFLHVDLRDDKKRRWFYAS
jgi:uncharacterized protein YcbK (DUF882 family)